MPARTLRRRAAPAGLMTRPTIRWCRRRGRARTRPPTGLPPPGRRRRTTARSMAHGGGRGRGRLGLHRAVGGADAGARLRRARRGAEANRAVWGCTSRNGGQGQNASGRLYRSQWIQRWGLDTARRLDAEIREGFEYWKSLVAQVDCDAQPGGHLYTAHRQKKMAFLENESRVMRGLRLRHAHAEQGPAARALRGRPRGRGRAAGAGRRGRASAQAGLRLPAPGARAGREHPSVQPGAGLARAERRLPVADPGGTVRARRVAFATGGYGAGRESAAGQPHHAGAVQLAGDARAVAGGAGGGRPESTVFITDTRTLRFYYRLLPDGRVQIGSRSAVHGADAQNPRHLALLKAGLAQFRRCATWTWIIPGGAGWTSATT